MQGTMPGVRRRGRPRTAWIDSIETWTGLSVEESIRMTEERDKWRKYVHWCGQPLEGGRLRNSNRCDMTVATIMLQQQLMMMMMMMLCTGGRAESAVGRYGRSRCS